MRIIEEKYNFILKLTAIFICMCIFCLSGGFHEYVSSITVVFCSIIIVVCMHKNKKLVIPLGVNGILVLFIPLAYLLVSIWAVDRGMAFLGFFKFLPILCLALLFCNIPDLVEQIKKILPLMGVCMIVFSEVMSRFHAFHGLVVVNDRLAGFFQYPNTFAAFLLICLIFALYKEDWIVIPYSIVLLFGIYETGSLTGYILTGLVLVVMIFVHRKLRKPLLIGGVILLVVVAIMFFTGHLSMDMVLKSSTFWGRVLYWQDSIDLLLKHPFGLGYYGYYFKEPSIQTGVYSVLSVHNEFLQFALDIGWIPAIFFYFVLIKNILRKDPEYPVENRVALVVLVLHSLFDYDFQFIGMYVVLMVLLTFPKTREVKIPKLSRCVLAVVLISVLVGSVICGLSNYYYVDGDYEKAHDLYSGHTMSQVQLLARCTEMSEAIKIADDISSRNSNISLVYDIQAAYKYQQGDLEGYMQGKLHAISLNPYGYEAYLDYMSMLAISANQFIQIGDYDSAKICVKRMRDVPDMLRKLEKRTSKLGWEIQDKPYVTLPPRYEEYIYQLEGMMYE